MKWTLWDRWILEGDLTVQEILDWFTVRLLLYIPCLPGDWRSPFELHYCAP